MYNCIIINQKFHDLQSRYVENSKTLSFYVLGEYQCGSACKYTIAKHTVR